MHTKSITQDINWLDAIDGLTVAKAIEYLNTLNPEHVLNYSLEGDTHGCRVEANVSYTVPMTNKEILAQLEAKYLMEIEYYEKALLAHTVDKRKSRMESCEASLWATRKKLAEARAKYSQSDDSL